MAARTTLTDLVEHVGESERRLVRGGQDPVELAQAGARGAESTGSVMLDTLAWVDTFNPFSYGAWFTGIRSTRPGYGSVHQGGR